MADTPTIPTIDTTASVDALNKLDAATKSAAQSINYAAAEANLGQSAFNLFGSSATDSGNMLSAFKNKLNDVSQSLRQSASLTADQTKQFSLLNIALVGARNQFEGLSNVDFSGMTTFGEQIEFIKDSIGDGATAIGKLSELATSMGQKMPEAFKGSLDMASKFVMGLARSADNAVKLRTAYIQLAAQTGELGEVYQASGEHLENLNMLVVQQQKMITDTAQATGMSSGQVEKYYSQLAAIPQALNSVVSGGKKGADSISMLTSVMQFAAGSGRKYSEVIDDIHESFSDFRISGEDALKFTSRMTELTNKFGSLGIEFKDVRNGLTGMSKEFKDITDAGAAASKMTENMAQVMGNYIESLTKTGMTSGHAIDVIKNMTGAISDLRIEQKAFLSAQTGGPGGLMGGFQIEKMIRDGDIKGVMDKVQAQMKKQFGRIVTLDEATQSQQSASQLTRQMTMLRSGPLGQFAKTDQDAYRVLESFKQKDSGQNSDFKLDSSAMVGTMDKGVEIQQKTYTEISRIRGIIEGSRGIANTEAANMIEEGFASSAGVFAKNNSIDPGAEGRNLLRDSMAQNSIRSGRTVIENKAQIASGKVKDTSGEVMAQSVNDYKKLFTELPTLLKMNLGGLKQSIMGEPTTNVMTQEKLREDIERRRNDVKAVPIIAESSSTAIKQTTNRVLSAKPEKDKKVEEVRVVAPPQQLAPQKVMVQVTGYCLRCKGEIEGSNQMASNSVAAGK